jgi:membrane-associated protease RseP (regulator of RpoE activity)
MFAQALAIFVMLAILSVLIIVHEFGHWSVARFFGFQTPVFGFGLPFGPSIVVGQKWNTQFKIHACLLGGYVAIPELGDESNAREDAYGVPLKPFRKFPIWQRALVAFAGVGFNIIFAWLVMFTMLATFGEPLETVIVKDLPASNPIAATAGVKINDKLVAIDDHKIANTDEVINYLGKHAMQPVVLHVQRGKDMVDLPMTPNDHGKVGMALVSKGSAKYIKVNAGPIELIGLTTDRLVKVTMSMLDALGMMFSNIGESFTHIGQHTAKVPGAAPKMGIEDLHGVLAVVAIGSQIAQQDWSRLFLFTIMISMDLAIINLVPYPALDGGHLAFMAWEAVRGKPMHERFQGEIVKWGFISLLVLMAVIMFNDVKALINGKLTIKPDKDEEQVQQAPAPAPTTTPPAGTPAVPANSPPAGQPQTAPAR